MSAPRWWRLAATGLAVALVAAAAAAPALAQSGPGAIPATAVPAQGTGLPLSEAALDSACAARAFPLVGAAIFGGLRDALGRARLTAEGPPLPPAAAVVRGVSVTAGWYAVLLLIGIAVLVFAGPRLRQVSDALERDPVGSLLTGVLASLAALPLLLAAVILLAVTIIGALLIPFAVVALVLAYAGLALLGFLAVASVAGRAALGARKQRMPERAASLTGVILGLTALLSVWLLAALFLWSPAAALVLRSMAIGVTAVAIAAGMGAAIRSLRRTSAEAEAVVEEPADEIAWQTPTPVGGVVAIKRSVG